jgi:transposase InsO family protein
MSMNAEEKMIRQRLSVLELAQALGNVSEACRQRGVSRTQFYEYKNRFAKLGIDGPKDLPPIHHSHPLTTAPEVEAQVLGLSLQHPAWGCNKLSDWLKLSGTHLSAPTIQRILNDNGMSTRYDRWLKLETKYAEEGIELTAEQVKFLEKQNPAFRELHVESSGPGELLSQDTYTVGSVKGVGRILLHAVVDTYSSYAFGFLHTTRKPEAAVAVVHNDVLPFYEAHDIAVKAILTDNGREFCGTDMHPFELYLALNEIEHRRTKVGRPQTNGFVERFLGTVKSEFFELAFRRKLYTSLDELQSDLDEWLRHYNTERPHQGYRIVGRRPLDTIHEFLERRQKEEKTAATAVLSEVPAVRHDA